MSAADLKAAALRGQRRRAVIASAAPVRSGWVAQPVTVEQAEAMVGAIVLIIEDLSSDDPEPEVRCTLAEFVRDNVDADMESDAGSSLVVQARALKPGESFETGGGAAPWMRITRAK